MLSDFPQEKRNLLDYKKHNFSKQKKSYFFPKGLIQAFDQKMPNSSLFRFGHNKTRKNAQRHAEKTETCFDYKKTEFFKVQKMAVFSKGLTHAFGQKMPIFSLFKFDQNKPKNSAF